METYVCAQIAQIAKSMIFLIFTPPPFITTMAQPPHKPRISFTEVYPNYRSRVIALHEYGMRFADISSGKTILLLTTQNLPKSTQLRIL
jgi:hypothetical protein